MCSFPRITTKNTIKRLRPPNPSKTRNCSSSSTIRITPRLLPSCKSHCFLIKSGRSADTNVWNSVLTGYCRWGGLDPAQKLFDEIPQRDCVSWNSLIAGHVFNGSHDHAYALFKKMLRRRLFCNHFTLGSVLKSVAGTSRLTLGRQLHSFVVKTGLDHNVFSGTALADMYAKCGSLSCAQSAFDSIPDPNTVSWNMMISGYAQAGDSRTVFTLFDRMEKKGFKPDEASFASVLPLINNRACSITLHQIHAKIVKFGWIVDSIVCNAAITAYSEIGSVADSQKVFDEMEAIRDLVSWNSMLAAYADHGLTAQAVHLFITMRRSAIPPDHYTFTSVISSCFQYSHIAGGRMLHALVVRTGVEGAVSVSNALIGMYIWSTENSTMNDAVKFFDAMEVRDDVSWNSMLTGFSQKGLPEDALKFFCRMRSECAAAINHYAFSAALRSCSDLAVLQLSHQIHGLVLRSGFISNDFVSSSLTYLYSNCGIIVDARKSFDESSKTSSVTWNSIIFGYAQHGEGLTALNLFNKMQELGVEADHITFVGLLSACSHSGLVEEGFETLKSIREIHRVPMRMEHYACGVDLFARAGRLEEAMDLISSMPFEPDPTVWMTLLGACRVHRNMEMAGRIAEHLMECDPTAHPSYVILSNMCAGNGDWDGRATIQRAMRDRGVIKVPGWSWIEVNKEVHSFNAEDRSHPLSGEIYGCLAAMMEEIEALFGMTAAATTEKAVW
ncbi:putative pentatricopeptide repeat-containing protein [Platanthera guangdongensis]|uniref:Pentatricopeptide repeat-containing protein n=1 Tax=Platanthera guangdongensis TaxID=2320717 RepID=A0ABR2M3J6_9ASPA